VLLYRTRPRKAVSDGRFVVERVRIPTRVKTSVDDTSCTTARRRRQARRQSLRRTLLRVACSSHSGLGIFYCLSEAHLVSHSTRVGSASGEVMARAFILAKSSRSPLKQLEDRVIPALWASATMEGHLPLSWRRRVVMGMVRVLVGAALLRHLGGGDPE
jgi:hypothetical protein